MIFLFISIQSSQFQGIKATIENMADKVYLILDREIKLVNKELNKMAGSVPDLMPKMAGQTHCIMILKQRLERSMEVNPVDTVSQKFYLPVLGQ